MGARARWLGLAAVALVLVGCSSGESDPASDAGRAAAPAVPGPAGEAAAGATGDSAAKPQPPSAGSGAAADRYGTSSLRLEPALVRTATLDVEVDDVAARAGEAAAQARSAGGMVAGDDRSGTGDRARATLELKVPPDRMDALLDRLGQLGTERQRTSSTEDVTEEVADVGSRVATMQASIARVRAILARADRIGDVVAVEGELSRRITELESLQARQRVLAGRTGYATVTLQLYAKAGAAAAPPADRAGFAGGLQDGWSAFTAVVGWLLTGLGAVLPFLLVLLPLALAARWALRRTRPAAAPAGPPGPPAGS